MRMVEDEVSHSRLTASGVALLPRAPLIKKNRYFIDLFAGCGGLSLGLCQAGWQGVFAIERAEDAFETLKANLLGPDSRYRFDWPKWLPIRAHCIERVLEMYASNIADLRGQVDLIAGGPPCQGFSFAGRRDASDPRNKMFEKYVEFVQAVQPRLLVLENVPGMDVVHSGTSRRGGKTYYEKLVEALEAIGYSAARSLMDASQFGVAQRRRRLVVIGVRRDDLGQAAAERAVQNLIESILGEGALQLQMVGGPVTAKVALSDLEIGRRGRGRTVDYEGMGSRKGYRQIEYRGPNNSYQQLLHGGASRMDSMRLARHSDEVVSRFSRILDLTKGRRGKNVTIGLRVELNMSKHRTVPMDPNAPAPTLTTLPDDILHYSEPRILTVRECARLQSFPDWFVFRGKYTTGGAKRRMECPRYTQVGNAVPPLLGRAIGVALLGFISRHQELCATPDVMLPAEGVIGEMHPHTACAM